ncbi:MAG: hypothetical protein MI923_04520 [Phycisphaerales bacterium]|nr:hypothetical protein [Phycisphaerales bacterium]
MRRINRLWTGLICVPLLATSPAFADDVLLIPESDTDRIMAFDPADGTLLDPDFIPDPGVVSGFDVFDRPMNAIDSGNGTVLVADQFRDVVVEFDFDGNYLGIFSNGGVRDTAVLDNIRGISLRPNGDLLVCNSGPSFNGTANSIVRFDSAGTLVDSFLFERYGGIDGPFDVLVLSDKILVASDGRNFVSQYDLSGKFTGIFLRFASDQTLGVFPQQMAETPSGNILVALFSLGVVREYTSTGTLIGQFDPGTLSLYRGVHELDNGNLLLTTSTGVFEANRFNIVINTEASASGFRYIERITLPPNLTKSAVAERAKKRTEVFLKHNMKADAIVKTLSTKERIRHEKGQTVSSASNEMTKKRTKGGLR